MQGAQTLLSTTIPVFHNYSCNVARDNLLRYKTKCAVDLQFQQ